uniref:C-type lectin domain-containing protein n=1 Tax=Cyprinus carpio TaxID=7962 RepID=A0A8C2BK53_CYPCA
TIMESENIYIRRNSRFRGLTAEKSQLESRVRDLTAEESQLETRVRDLTAEKNQLINRESDLTAEKNQLRRDFESLNNKGPISFFMSTERKSWSDSRQYCRDRGADLVIINTEEKQVSLFSERVWIGLSDREQEGNMKWVENSPLKQGYTRHYPVLPNSANFEPQDAPVAEKKVLELRWDGSRETSWVIHVYIIKQRFKLQSEHHWPQALGLLSQRIFIYIAYFIL